MSREFKFRCWISKPRNESKPYMAYADLFQNDETYLLGHTGGGEYCEDESKVMQYIGRKDKNGVDIYDEDIVLITMANGAIEQFIVKWSDEATGFRFIDKDGLDWKVRSDNILEVIGNTYDVVRKKND